MLYAMFQLLSMEINQQMVDFSLLKMKINKDFLKKTQALNHISDNSFVLRNI